MSLEADSLSIGGDSLSDNEAQTDPDTFIQTLLTFHYVQEKVGLAWVIMSAAIQFSALLLRYNYYPLRYQHATHPTVNVACRHHLFDQLHTQADEHMLTFEKGTEHLPTRGRARDIIEHSNRHIPMPALDIQWQLLHILEGVSVWDHPACCATVQHIPVRPRPPPEPPPPPLNTHAHADTHYVANWSDIVTKIFSSFSTEVKLRVWAQAGSGLEEMPQLRQICTIEGHMLWATTSAWEYLSTIQTQRLYMLFSEHGKCAFPVPIPPHRDTIFSALLYQMQRALAETNLGRWAELMQASIPFWPFTKPPSLRTIWRKAHTNEWHVHLPPPQHVICVCVNLRTCAVYVGQTGQSPVQRLRKHHTDARSAADCATFHKLLLTTNMADWVAIPVQYCSTLIQTGRAERTWWSDRHWAVNDIPPGISQNDTSNSKRAYITGTILHVLQELIQPKQERDTQRVKALQTVLRDTASQLALPFHVCGTIVVPNLTKP